MIKLLGIKLSSSHKRKHEGLLNCKFIDSFGLDNRLVANQVCSKQIIYKIID